MMSQSWIMMYAAGGAWQYGKRRISAMSNQEFNRLLPIDLLKEHTVLLRSAIPTIQQSIQDMTPLINTLMTQFGTFVNEAIKAIPQTVSNVLGTPGGEFSNIPTTAGQAGGGLPPPGTAAFLHYFAQLAKQTQATPEQLALTSGKTGPAKANTRITGTESSTSGLVQWKGYWRTMSYMQRQVSVTAMLNERFTQSQVKPSAHIVDRRRSNVSLQSLKMERAKLLLAIKQGQSRVKQEQAAKGRSIRTKNQRVAGAYSSLRAARLQLANFMKMHGARF